MIGFIVLLIGLATTSLASAQRPSSALDSLMAAQAPVVDIRYDAFKERVLGILPGGPLGGWVVATQRVGQGMWLGRFGPTGTALWDTLLSAATLGMPAPLRDVPPHIFVEPSSEGARLVVVCPHTTERTLQVDQRLVRLVLDTETGDIIERKEIGVPKCREVVGIVWLDNGLRLITNRQDSLPAMLLWPWTVDTILETVLTAPSGTLRAPIRMAPNGEANGGSLNATEYVAANLAEPARIYADGFFFWAGTDPITTTGRYYARALTYNGNRVLRGLFVRNDNEIIAYPIDSLRGPRSARRRRGATADISAQLSATQNPRKGLPRKWGNTPWMLPYSDNSVVAMRSANGVGWIVPLRGPVRNLGRVRAVPLYVTGPRFTSSGQLLPAYTLFPESGTTMGLTGYAGELAQALTAWGFKNADRVDRYLTPRNANNALIWVHEDVSKGRIRIWVNR